MKICARSDPLQRPIDQIVTDKNSSEPTVEVAPTSGILLQGDPLSHQPQSVFLRGFGADSVVLVWNGFKVNDFTSPAGAFTGEDLLREFSSEVKVLKGPQNLLYGSQAMGGVIELSPGSADRSKLQLWTGNSINGNGVSGNNSGGSIAFSKISKFSSADETSENRGEVGAGAVFFDMQNSSILGDRLQAERSGTTLEKDEKRIQSASIFGKLESSDIFNSGTLANPIDP